jgi:hypothetical protein
MAGYRSDQEAIALEKNENDNWYKMGVVFSTWLVFVYLNEGACQNK